jgi:sulfite reductase (NADPH) flavoprotein alpha-component
VQDRLLECAGEIRAWIAEGAAIYLCGSLVGMAPGVDSTLRSILGDNAVEQLAIEGRYRRDVY